MGREKGILGQRLQGVIVYRNMKQPCSRDKAAVGTKKTDRSSPRLID